MNDIQQADRRLRAIAIALLAVGTVIGVMLLLLAERLGPVAEAWLTGDPAQFRPRLTASFGALALAIALPVLAFAGYLWWLGARIVGAERFPPPGLRVIRDTPVVQGSAARQWGRFAQLLALVLIVVVAWLIYALWRLLALLST